MQLIELHTGAWLSVLLVLAIVLGAGITTCVRAGIKVGKWIAAMLPNGEHAYAAFIGVLVLCLVGLCALEYYSSEAMTPKELAEAAYDCNQYGLPMRVTEWTPDGKPAAVQCYVPQQQPQLIPIPRAGATEASYYSSI
jgi:hypothetical protein